MGFIVTIDGPSGAGKGYIASTISKKLNLIYIDTGAMYRAFALYVNENNINMDVEEDVIKALNNVKLDFNNVNINNENVSHIFLNGEDVESKIRTEKVGMMASIVSANTLVRKDMVSHQREYGKTQSIIMEGRDIGSVVFPNADVKIFLVADEVTRAKRRHADLLKKDPNITFEKVLEDIKKRDEADINKKISPLVKTDDMIEIDNTLFTKEEIVEHISRIIQERM